MKTGEHAEPDARPEEGLRVTGERVDQLSFRECLVVYAAVRNSTRSGILGSLVRTAPSNLPGLLEPPEKRAEASFMELVAQHRLDPQTLAGHLKILEHAGLVHSRGEREHSSYRISNLGMEVLGIDDLTTLL